MSNVKQLMGEATFKKHGRGPDKKKRKKKGSAGPQASGRNAYVEKLLKDVNTSPIYPKTGAY